MERRQFLRGTGILGATAVAGCLGLFETRSVGRGNAPPLVENRPDAVYYPTHIEGMKMIGMKQAGDYSVGFMYSFPHRFWTVTGSRTEKVSIGDSDSVHLMASIWDKETGIVLPVDSGVNIKITKDGNEIANKSPWPMISQNMGFHYGDNYALEGDGRYRLEFEVGAMNAVRKTRGFEDKFDRNEVVTIDLSYTKDERDGIMYRPLDDKKGQKGAVDLMKMDMVPTSVAPSKSELPGKTLEEKTSGDAVFVTTVIREGPLVGDKNAYIAVSPRTPYNRIILPMMFLSARVERNGETVFDGSLKQSIDPELNYHYGAQVDNVKTGDKLTVSVDTPPQVSRHEGYETAFIDMPPVEYEVP